MVAKRGNGLGMAFQKQRIWFVLITLLAGCGPSDTNYSFAHDVSVRDEYIVVIFNGYHKPRLESLQTVLSELGLPPVRTPTMPILTAKGDLRVGSYNHGRCWQNYEGGPLRVVGILDTDANYDKYDAIWKVYVYQPGTPPLCGHEKLAEFAPDYPYAD